MIMSSLVYKSRPNLETEEEAKNNDEDAWRCFNQTKPHKEALVQHNRMKQPKVQQYFQIMQHENR